MRRRLTIVVLAAAVGTAVLPAGQAHADCGPVVEEACKVACRVYPRLCTIL